MRILYLLYDHQVSFTSITSNTITKCPWVDALLYELIQNESITIALAVPVNSNIFHKCQKERITLFGLPFSEERNIFRKIYQRVVSSTESTELNNFARQAINEFKPDIIQIFGSENPFGLLASQLTIPIIIHIQGNLKVVLKKWFTGISRWHQFRYASLKNLILMRGSFHGFTPFTKMANRETIILQNCKYFMGRTNFDRRIISLFSPNSTYFHCDEFIRNEFFETQWNFPLQNEVLCVSILRGSTYKGIDLIVESMMILKKYSTFSFKFKICGVSDNEEIVKIIKDRYKKVFGLLNIEFLGKLSANDLVKTLCNSNFYIHPSYIENSPNSVCEAMALGMPIVSTNVGGVSSIIKENEEGILVQEGEPYSLASAIIELIKNYEYAKLLGQNARIRAIHRHDPNIIVSRLLDIYNTILSNHD